MTNTFTPPFSQLSYELKNCQLVSISDLRDIYLLSDLLVKTDPWKTLGYQSSNLQHYLTRSDPALHRYVILVDMQHVGILCIRYPWLRGPYIELIGFIPSHCGHGLGREILLWIENQSTSSFSNLWACVSDFNSYAKQFYQKYGFQHIAEISDLIKNGHKEILLRKHLAS